MRKVKCIGGIAVLLSVSAACGFAQQDKLPADDLTPNFKAPAQETDFIKRVEMVPMRDGTKLYTVIVIPKGAHDAPIMLERTPYNAAGRSANGSTHMAKLLGPAAQVFVDAGYIMVYQDVRGKYGSE